LKQITLRGIPVEVEKAMKKEAERKGVSLNKAFIALLENTAGTKKRAQRKQTLHHDLDHLCGTWTKREADEFTRNLEFQRRIDEGLWKNEK